MSQYDYDAQQLAKQHRRCASVRLFVAFVIVDRVHRGVLCMIFKKAGYSGCAGAAAVSCRLGQHRPRCCGSAFSDWPVQRELRASRPGTGGGYGGTRPASRPRTAPPASRPRHRHEPTHHRVARARRPAGLRAPARAPRPQRTRPSPAPAPAYEPPPAASPPAPAARASGDAAAGTARGRAARGQLGEDAPNDRGPRGESLAVHSHRARPVGLGVRRDQGGADRVRPRPARAAALRDRLTRARGLRRWWCGCACPTAATCPGSRSPGLTGITIYHVALNFGEVKVSAGAASLLIAAGPVFTALMSVAFLGERLKWIGWLGIAHLVRGRGADLVRRGRRLHVRARGAARAALGGVDCGVLHPVERAAHQVLRARDDVVRDLARHDPDARVLAGPVSDRSPVAPVPATLAVIYLGVFPGAIAYVLWSYALARMPASILSTFLYLSPALAILIAWMWIGEVPQVLTLVGGALAVAGVVVVNTRGRARSARRASKASPRSQGRSPSATCRARGPRGVRGYCITRKPRSPPGSSSKVSVVSTTALGRSVSDPRDRLVHRLGRTFEDRFDAAVGAGCAPSRRPRASAAMRCVEARK